MHSLFPPKPKGWQIGSRCAGRPCLRHDLTHTFSFELTKEKVVSFRKTQQSPSALCSVSLAARSCNKIVRAAHFSAKVLSRKLGRQRHNAVTPLPTPFITRKNIFAEKIFAKRVRRASCASARCAVCARRTKKSPFSAAISCPQAAHYLGAAKTATAQHWALRLRKVLKAKFAATKRHNK